MTINIIQTAGFKHPKNPDSQESRIPRNCEFPGIANSQESRFSAGA